VVSYDKPSGSRDFFLLTELLGREDEDEDANSYWITLSKKEDNYNLEEAALDLTEWRTGVGTDNGPVARRTTQ
jgi:hypothetical protein